MRILTLIRTSAYGVPGSMQAYEDMVAGALAATRAPGAIEVRVCDARPTLRGGMWRRHFWRVLCMRRALRQSPADLYHLLDGSLAAFLPPRVLARTVATVHDLIPLLQARGELPGRPSLPALGLIRRNAWALARCRALCAVSECTRRDAVRLLGARDVRVIQHAIRDLPDGKPGSAPEGVRVLLHVGHDAAYKNRMGVLDVFARLGDIPGLELRMVGPAPAEAVRRRADAVGRVRFVVDGDDATLSACYREAALLLFPSLYEGFGMPLLEAMAQGCPVVCSQGGALPEVAGAAALSAPVNDVAALAEHCRALLRDEALRGRLARLGYEQAALFSRERMGRDLWNWYRDVLEGAPCAC